METVNSVVNTASKLIWGETNANKQTTEPVSGQTGAGTVVDPYDKGNTDSSITSDTTAPITTTTEPTSTSKEPASTMTSTSTDSTSDSTSDTTAPTTTTTEPTSTSKEPASTMTSSSTDPTSKTQPSTNDPATAAHSTSTEPTQKQQGADRPTDSPTPAQTEAVKDKSNIAEAQQEGGNSHVKITDDNREELAAKGELPKIPDDHSGEPMKMHGGAAKEASANDSVDPREEGKKDRSASVSHEGGGTHGKVEGTGEQWVKSSGLAAEGGDFDATKPGAGKEANRLLEEKGIKKDDRGTMATDDGSSPDLGSEGTDSVKKESKMAKLKEKLHIGHGKKSDA